MCSKERKTIEFFAQVGHLVSSQEKESRSKEVVINDVSWYLRADFKNGNIHIYIGCLRIPVNCTIYATVELTCSHTSTQPMFHRFDSEVSEISIHRFIPPKIRRSSYPVRGVKVATNVLIESIVRPETFTAQDDLSDIVFEVGGVKLHLHKVILARASPVFKTMLFGEFAESCSTHVVLPNKRVDLFIDFLSTIYPPFTEINAIRARYLLPLYMEYQMTEMASKCEYSLCTSGVYAKPGSLPLSEAEIEEVFDHLVLANMFCLEDLRDLAVAGLGQVRAKSWESSEVFASLSDDLRCLIYSARVRDLEDRLDEILESNVEVSVDQTEQRASMEIGGDDSV